jgi:hypothetical protein
MDEFLYLEADEEITSVIDKLKGLEGGSVALVAPKGSSIVQSLVSLKLLKKEATGLKKDIAIVTADEVGQNLSTQIGLKVFADVKSHKPLEIELDQIGEKDKYIEINESKESVSEKSGLKVDVPKQDRLKDNHTNKQVQKDGIAVHRYDENGEDSFESKEESLSEDSESAESASDEAEKSSESHEDRSIAQRIERDGTLRRRAASVGYMGPRSTISMGQNIETTRTKIEPNRVTNNAGERVAKKYSRRKLLIIMFISLLSLVLVAFVDLVIAKMAIDLQVEASVFEKNYDVTVEKDRVNIDDENAIIGGRQIIKEKEFEDKIVTSGEKDVGEKAKGSLVFKNESGLDEQIPAGTIVKSNGIEFSLDNAITVPKATLNQAGDKVLGQVSGSVTAEDVGTSGNLPAGTVFSVLGESKLTATGSTTGGSTKKVKIVTKADIDNAKKQYQEKKAADFIEDKDIQEGEIMPEGAGLIDMSEFSVDKNVGDEAEQFIAKAKIKFTTIVYRQSDLNKVLTAVAEKTLLNGKGLVLAEGDLFSATLKEDKQNIGQMILDGKIKSHVGPKLNLPELVKSWRGKPISKAKSDLSSMSGVELKSLVMSPSFALPVSPLLTRNIKINISYLEK